MKGKKNNNNLKSFFSPLKDPCASSDSSVIDLHQKTNLASPTPQAPALVPQPPSSSFLPPFPALLLPNLYQYNKFPDMRILSWNINSVHNDEKLNLCHRMAASCHPLFILLQETHAASEKDLDHLKNCLRKYLWFKDPFLEQKQGLAIGVRRMEGLHNIEPYPIESSESGLFGLRIKIFNTEYAVMNVYHHCNLKLPFMQDQIRKFFSKDGLNVLGGDFNWDLNEPPFKELTESSESWNLSRLGWSEPTHFQERCINHVFIPSNAPSERIFVNAIPSGFKDHAMIIGGTSIKEWKLKSNKKRIPEYLIKDPKFINALINEVGNYVEGDPVSCLIKLKEKAWELVPLWKDKEKEAHLFKELWKLQTIIKCLAKTRILRKTSAIHSFSSLELELLHTAAIGWNGSQDDKKWRIKAIPKMIKAGMDQTAVLEQQLRIFVDEHPSRLGRKSSPHVKGVIVDGVISHDDNVVKKAIKDFWESLLSTERPYNKDSLDELIADHHPHFPPVERHDVDRKKVDKLLQRTNNTSTGPNGIPFSLYKATQEKYFNMWVELIQQAGEMMEFPPFFGESQLCLIPKVKNIPCPDQFRPISVTNSDYRIVMRYWAKWLMEITSGVISKEQHAMFKGRSIDEAVETVYDSFYEALAEGKDVTLLQTDFCKAYDYVNHDALLHILKGLNTPLQAIYVVEKVLQESVTWLPNIGGSKRGGNNESIQS